MPRKSGRSRRTSSRAPGRILRRGFRPAVGCLEHRVLLSIFTVDSTGDTLTYVAGTYQTGHKSGTLRDAITAADDATSGVTIIDFAIPTADGTYGAATSTWSWSIAPSTPLPNITSSVTIDGTSEASVLNVAYQTPLIELRGDGDLTKSGDGLFLATGSDGSMVKGLIINRWTDSGIRIDSSNNTIAGNWVGTDVTGGGRGRQHQLWHPAHDHRRIEYDRRDRGRREQRHLGQLRPGQRRDLRRWRGEPVRRQSHRDGLLRPSSRSPNTNGIVVYGSGATIGGIAAGAGNVISGNSGAGSASYGLGLAGDENVAEGNLIGTDITGMARVGNQPIGVVITGKHNLVGTSGKDGVSDAFERNVIAGNAIQNVLIFSGDSGGVHYMGATENVVAGNWIGFNLDSSETPVAGLGAEWGVFIYQCSNNWIGVNSANPDLPENGDQGNVISGNGTGVYINGSENVVAGNLIGTTPSGTTALPNSSDGVVVAYGDKNLIGTSGQDATNVAIEAQRDLGKHQ